MKNIFKIMLYFFALALVVGCEDDYEAPDDELLDIAWYNSLYPGAAYVISVDKHLSFMDLSQGAVSHEWRLKEGDGTYFLNNDFYGKDTLADYIDETLGLVTDNPTVHVLFSKPGLKTVQLYNTFPEKVTYNADFPFEAKKVGEVWVIDTTFTVDVFGKMLPAFQVFQVLDDGTDSLILDIAEDVEVDVTDSTSILNINVEAGTVLKYVDMTTTDRPSGRTWTINRGNDAETFTDSVISVSYLKLGKGKIGSLKSDREESGDVPKASATKKIPLLVNVTPSTKPFAFLGELEEAEDETISFRVSGEVASIEGDMAAFTVHAKNASGFDQDLNVMTAKISNSDASIIELTVSEAIYNSDEITVSFDESLGTITSTDSRTLISFSGEVVAMHFTEAANPIYYSAEDTDGWFLQHTAHWSIGNSNAVSGNSFKYIYDAAASPAKKAKIQSTGDNQFGVAPGNYQMKISVFLEEGSEIKTLSTNLSTADWLAVTWDLTTVEKGKWVTLTQDVTLGSHTKFILQVAAADCTSDTATLYIDDIQFVQIEERP